MWSKKPINFTQRKLTKTQQPGVSMSLRTGQSEFNKILHSQDGLIQD